jgi:hypothetical protein
MITPRLLAGIQIEEPNGHCSWISIEEVQYPEFQIHFDLNDTDEPKEFTETGLYAPSCGARHVSGEMIEPLLSFLLSSIEAYRYHIAHDIPEGDREGELFDRYVIEWAMVHENDLECIQCDLEHLKTLGN